MIGARDVSRCCGRSTWWLGVLAIGALAILPASRAADAWQSSFDGTGRAMSDGWTSVAFHLSGDLIVTGLSYADETDQFDCTLIVARLAKADGSVVWRRDQRVRTDYPPYDCTYAERVLVDPTGDVVLGRAAGVTKRSGETGQVIWSRQLGAFPRHGPFLQTTALDPHGNVLFGGGFGDNIDDSSMVVGKLAGATGAVLWQRSFRGTAPGDEYNHPVAIASDGDGNVLALGILHDLVHDGDDALELPRRIALKLAADDGDVLWNVETEFDLSQGDPQTSLVADASGDVLHVGAGLSILKRAGATGELLWRYRSDQGALVHSYGSRIGVGPGGDAVAVWQMSQGPDASHGSSVLAVRVNGATGDQRWSSEIERAELLADAPRDLAVTAAGDVVVAVLSESEVDRFDFLVVALNAADGTLDWQADVDGPGSMTTTDGMFGNEFVRGLAVDAEHVAAVGSLRTAGGGADGVAVALGFDGQERWRNDLAEHYTSFDGGNALAILPDGDVAAAGQATNEDNRLAFVVRRIRGGNGDAVWTKVLGDGRATSVASDASGDVVVAGLLGRDVTFPAVGTTAVVAKLDGGDGDELWRFTVESVLLDDVFDPHVVPLGLAPNGDVFVAVTKRATKRARNTGKGTVYRLAARDGSRVWRRSVMGRWVVGMAVDANGDLLLRTFGSSGRRERITKLDGTSGQTVWSAGTGIQARLGRLAVTPSGDAIVGGTLERDTHDPVVLALAGTTGVRRWRRVLGRGSTPLVASTPAGDALVAIFYPNLAPPVAERVLKLDGLSGATQWDRSISFAEIGGCEAAALASDAAGNALLGGCLDNSIFELEFGVTSLTAEDGSTQWGRRLVGIPSRNDFPHRTLRSRPGVRMITTDALGNVVAVGVSADEETGLDFTVVKWSSVDGSDDLAGDD